tara:strand:- start:2976 stop:4160 length:1185 start_codon:yes stop_codon:yes gene_type:complete
MKELDIIIIGSGLYVCGKGTAGYGTVLPAIFEWKRLNQDSGAIHCVATSINSSTKLLQKAEELKTKTGVELNIKTYPENDISNNKNPYEQALKNSKKPACAIVAVPDHLHYQVAKDCLDSGLHTLIAKPFTPTYEEGKNLVDLANKNNVYGAVEFHKRWDKSNILLKDKIEAGIIGSPVNCWIEYSQRKSVPLSFFKDWASKTSILQYLGVHYIDIVRFVTSAFPKRVMAIGQKSEIMKHNINTYDAIQCIIEWEMPDQTSFTETILTNWIDPENSSAMSDQKIKFVGTKGRYEADQKDRGIRLNTDDLGIEDINPDFCMSYGTTDGNIHWRGYGIDSITKFLDDVNDIENGLKTLEDLQSVRPTFHEALISTMVIESAHKSLKNDSRWEIIKI